MVGFTSAVEVGDVAAGVDAILTDMAVVRAGFGLQLVGK